MGQINLQSLLERSRVSVYRGRLIIEPFSGGMVPNDWLAKNKVDILSSISCTMEVPFLLYQGYETKKGKYEGVGLTFHNLSNDTHPLAYFNACLKRQRTTKAGKKGDSLPVGHFSIFLQKGKRPPAFYQFWQRIGLDHPRFKSAYHEKMGQLSDLVFTANIKPSRAIENKINNESLTLVNLTDTEIRQEFSFDKSSITFRENPDKTSITSREGSSISKPRNASDTKTYSQNKLQVFKPQNTEHSYTGTQINSDTFKRVTEVDMPDNKSDAVEDVKNQTDAQWWASYNSIE